MQFPSLLIASMPRLRTFFSGLLLLSLAANPVRPTTVAGTVQVDSKPEHARSLSDIVVWLESSVPAPASSQPEHVTLLQKDKTFRPHVLIIRTGTVVDFPNDDPIFHNAFSTFEGQVFDIGLYPPGTTRSIRFRRPGIVRVFCNIHPSMSAVIVVVDSPHFTPVSPNGDYRFRNVADGSYQLNVYDERATDKAQEQRPVEVERDQAEITVPVIRLSEAGYVPLPHKNKFGKDYPPGSENSGYDGVMK